MEQDGGETDNNVAGHSDFITLAQPRSGVVRILNEYIDTPLPKPTRLKEVNRPPVSAQPTVKQLHGDTIICRQCRRCKCEACRNPRHLPQKWICNNKCLCSASNIVDYCSCMCCVKGLFYHWAKDYEMDTDVSCADKPCSCSPHHRWLRWGCLGCLALPLPCLCCYWPLKGLLNTFEGCYAKCTGHGCTCAPSHKTEPPEKRLLSDS
ncbi:protein sprouty [Parasteatoda tepidariorum]|uniref:protein sprouty n=1 Tax=Parasteatoda tepidariorum TaxID=114398 RepID=UPI00077FD04B|nr:protein sprouty-like [Parasteatoda tepidariorum]